MAILGYDKWKLATPPEYDEGNACDDCGQVSDVRIDPAKSSMHNLVCIDCYGSPDASFYDLMTLSDHAQEEAEVRADFLHDQMRDRRMEDEG